MTRFPEEPSLKLLHNISRIVLVVPALTLSNAAAQERLLERQAAAGVRDGGGMFSEEAVRRAGEALRKIERDSGVSAVVETVGGLNGEEVDEAAIRLARRSEIKGVFVLVAKKEMKIEVLASSQFRDALSRDGLHRIRTSFTEGFRKQDFDRGLREGVDAIGAVVESARAEKKLPTAGAAKEEPRPTSAPPTSALVARDQVKLTLEGARVIVAGAEKQAAAMKLKSNIAVVDEGGHLLSFDRMDGARPASVYTAITKAVTAATFRQPSGPIPAGSTNPDPILNLGIEHAAAASGGKLTTLKGGVPVVVDGQVIGGVGAGGGSGEQDAEVVRAGIDAFLKRLDSPASAPTNIEEKKDRAVPGAVKD